MNRRNSPGTAAVIAAGPHQMPSRRGRALGLAAAALVMLGSGAGLQAQTGQTLTLDDAIRIALARSIDVQRSDNAVEQSRASVEQARYNFLPTLNASLSPNVRFDPNSTTRFDPATNTFGNSSNFASTSLSLGASSSYNLFNGYADVASLAQARNQLTASTAGLERARQSVAYDAATRFIQVLLDAELIRTAEDNLASERSQLELIEALAAAGTRPNADVFTQRAATASAELQVLNARRNHDLSVIRLKQLLQLDAATDYQLVTPPAVTGDDTSAIARNGLIEEALAGRADIRAQQARIAAAEEGIRVARSGYYPTIGISGSLGTSYSSSDASTGFGGQFFSDNPSASIGATLSIPIFDRHRTETNEELARIQYENEQLSLQSLQQQVTLEIQQAYLDYITAAKQLDVATQQVAAAREALAAQQERYRVGASTLAEVSDARARYTQAVVTETQASYTLILRRRGIDFYRGLP